MSVDEASCQPCVIYFAKQWVSSVNMIFVIAYRKSSKCIIHIHTLVTSLNP